MEKINPYNDDYLEYDERFGRYVITEKAIEEQCGIDLRGRLSRWGTTQASNVINALTRKCSQMIYNYIHKFNERTDIQDFLLSHNKQLRNILLEVLCEQMTYLISKGDYSMSPKREERALAISDEAMELLNQTITEIGVPITYTGSWERYGYFRYS